MRFTLASLLALTLSSVTVVFADVEFTNPAAGANVEAGTVQVQWKDSGSQPLIEDLTEYSLSLMTGGNTDNNMLALATFASQTLFSSGNQVNGTFGTGIASPVKNGFFFRITSAGDEGGTIINYSSRFSITGLTGVTPPQFRQAAEALDGTTVGPKTMNNVTGASTMSSSMTATASSSGATAGLSASGSGHAKSNSTITVTTGNQSTASSTKVPFTGASNSDSLSTGAQAGIAVAAAVLGIALFSVLVWAFLKDRKRFRSKQDGHLYHDGKAELSGNNFQKLDSVSTVAELSSNNSEAAETEGDGMHHEMEPAHVPRAELEGNSVPELHGDSPVVSPLTPVQAWTPVTTPATPILPYERV